MKIDLLTRRRAAAQFASWMAASPLLRAQQPAGEPPGRIAPAAELVNTFEFEEMARRSLGEAVVSPVADDGRRPFDHITLRPRMMRNALSLDLTLDLFGEKMFAPILVGPVADQKRFHPDAERAMVSGAAAARTAVVVSCRASIPFEQIAAQAKTPLWYQVYPDAGVDAIRDRIARAVDSGAKAVSITTGAPGCGTLDGNFLDRVCAAARVPVLVKGIMEPEEARLAAGRGVSGIIVSNHGQPGLAATIDALPAVVDAAGKTPVLVDGGFRRGTHVLMALALGARAVLVARPPVWALAAYGAEGVGIQLRMIETELARDMAICGRITLSDIDRTLVSVHRR